MFYSTRRIDLQMQLPRGHIAAHHPSHRFGVLFVPITLVAYIGIAPEKNNAVAGIVNFNAEHMGSRWGRRCDDVDRAAIAAAPSETGENIRVDTLICERGEWAGLRTSLTPAWASMRQQLTAYARIYQSAASTGCKPGIY